MDANINHGSSGGPVCNEKGEVIGLTTFGSIENTGGLAAGLNFAVPVSILSAYLDTAGITPRPSRSAQLFARAIAFYQQRHYETALKNFQKVQQLNSHYPGIYSYMADCGDNIKKGKGRVEIGPTERLLLISCGLLLLMGGIAGFRIYRSASRDNTI